MPIEPGKTIGQLLGAGELAAAINIQTDDPDVQPLIPNALEAGFAAFDQRGHYPINHLIAVRDEVLERYPEAAVALFDAFAQSKNLYLEKLRQRPAAELTGADRTHLRMMGLGRDPLPYGIAPNRAVLENLVAHARTQNILRRPVTIESLFAPATRTSPAKALMASSVIRATLA